MVREPTSRKNTAAFSTELRGGQTRNLAISSVVLVAVLFGVAEEMGLDLSDADVGHMAVDRDVVGWVGKDEVGWFVPHQRVEQAPVAGITTDQTMAPETPHVA
jgi:hypothetical protein